MAHDGSRESLSSKEESPKELADPFYTSPRELAFENERKFQIWLHKMHPHRKHRVWCACGSWAEDRFGHGMSLHANRDAALFELKRRTQEKVNAFNNGFIRPFLFLVSLHPLRRLFIARLMLKKDLTSKKWYGDAHKEAYFILRNSTNIGDKEGCWYKTLLGLTCLVMEGNKNQFRVSSTMTRDLEGMKRGLPAGKAHSRKPKDQYMEAIEEFSFLSLAHRAGVYDYTNGHFPMSNSHGMTADERNTTQMDDYRTIVERLRSHGWHDAGLIHLLAIDAIDPNLTNLLITKHKLIEFVEGLMPHSFLGKLVYYGRYKPVPLLVVCILQRMFLAMTDIQIDDFYPSY